MMPSTSPCAVAVAAHGRPLARSPQSSKRKKGDEERDELVDIGGGVGGDGRGVCSRSGIGRWQFRGEDTFFLG